MGWVAKDPIGKIEKKIFEILILSVWKYVEKPQNAPIRPTLPYKTNTTHLVFTGNKRYWILGKNGE